MVGTFNQEVKLNAVHSDRSGIMLKIHVESC